MVTRDWIRLGKEKGASDLHLEAGTPPVFRIQGELIQAGEPISHEDLLNQARELLDAEQWDEYLARRSVDLSQTISGVRCRINAYRTVRGIALAIRLLSSFQSSLRDCNLHPDLRRFVEAKTGLILVTGPTGSGKSTTLAALIEEMNRSQARHVIVLESPIEYFLSNRKSFIRQREIPTHSPSFEQAIVDSMRENPDVLVVGEMRTPDVMRLTLNAAETGHLVLATMHSSTCAEALARICMSFPAELQGSIRAQLADSLVGVICQRLDYLPQPGLRVPRCEVLWANSPARSTIRSGQFSQILSVLQTGGEEGLWTFERYQRWMEQKRDWVKPSQATPLPEEPRPVRPASEPARATPTRPKPARPASTPSAADDGRIEIPLEDADLEELARRISSEGSKRGPK